MSAKQLSLYLSFPGLREQTPMSGVLLICGWNSTNECIRSCHKAWTKEDNAPQPTLLCSSGKVVSLLWGGRGNLYEMVELCLWVSSTRTLPDLESESRCSCFEKFVASCSITAEVKWEFTCSQLFMLMSPSQCILHLKFESHIAKKYSPTVND